MIHNHRELIPDWVILEPGLTVSLPATITASTGMDALCHCIESLLSVNANPVSAANNPRNLDLDEVGRIYQEVYHG